MSTVTDPPLRRASGRIVMMRLRRRAARKVMQAARIATLRLKGTPHEEARARMQIGVEQYRAARRWLEAAVDEADESEGLLTVHEALQAYAERHVLGVVRVGMMRDRGSSEAEIRARLQITEMQYRLALDWYRDAVAAASSHHHD